jgi:16S rRNA processing protein RimM
VTDYYLIAKIEQLVGNKGFVRIKPISNFPERFPNLKKVYLDFWGDKKKFIIDEVSEHQNSYLLKFRNFESRRDSQVLVGREIFVDDKDVVKLPEDHFFIHDLIDVKIFIKREKFGVVKDVLKLPANDVLVVEQKDGTEKLIPFVLAFIEKFEPEKKRLSLKIDKNFFDEDDEN